MNLLELPLELLLMIVDDLSLGPLSRLSRTCRTLHTLLTPQLNEKLASGDRYFLRWAVKRNRPISLSRALSLSSDTSSYSLSRLLLKAIWRDHSQCVRVLLDHGVDPNRRFLGDNALFSAVTQGSMEIVRMLLWAGADINGRSSGFKLTTMQLARLLEDQEMIRLLLEFGEETD